MLDQRDREHLREAERTARRLRKLAKKPPLHAPVKPHRGRVRDNAYLQWLRHQDCRVKLAGRTDCSGPIEAAHLRYADHAAGRAMPGMQRKSDDRWATSLCRRHHEEQHAQGDERAWWGHHGLDGSEVAQAQFAAFTAGQDTEQRREP